MSSLPKLDLDGFPAFYEAVHGYRPFPWQARLARQVAAGESWPTWLALPTASGKTSAIDIAVFALALQAERPARERTAARRIFFVVDRRVIVDQASDHAFKLAEALARAETGVLLAVADRLRHLSGDREGDGPLDVFQLRGGIYRDDAWVRSPLRPTVIASTVDQVGSRLLFRGYGLRNGALWPVHAGLVANDALLILDEAHCSNPFLQTLEAVARYRRQAEMPLGLPFQYSVMSATPPAGATVVFGLGEDDHSHDVLKRRLRASKWTRLVLGPKSKGKKGEREFVDAVAREAVTLANGDRRVIGIIVNRVKTAKAVAERITAYQHEKVSEFAMREGAIVDHERWPVMLLTGRTRPVDADQVRQRLSHLQTGHRAADTPTCFVVATQTLEVGADLDFDVVVTECASLDALRQRFGRLNRAGRDIDARGVVIVRAEYAEVTKEEDADPIYGLALPRTWAWLKATADASDEVDFGVETMRRARHDRPAAGVEMRPDDAAVMLPAHVDSWVQTSPLPSPDPEVAVFLHGHGPEVADLQVCWRADLSSRSGSDEQTAVDTVGLCPPTSRECMPVPLRVFRRWLAGREAPDDIADVDQYFQPPDDDESREAEGEMEATQVRWCVRWRGVESGRDASTIVRTATARTLRPGEVVVIPASFGGWDAFGHVLKAPDAGGDYGEETNATQRRRALLRLTPALVETWRESEARELAHAWMKGAEAQEDVVDVRTDETLQAMLLAIEKDPNEPAWKRLVAKTIRVRPRARVLLPYPTTSETAHEYTGWLVTTRNRIPVDALRAMQRDPTIVFTDEDDGAVATVDVPLRAHLDGVARWALHFASSIGLPEDLVADVEVAARLHDVGKVDRRFQAMLRGGNRWLASTGELLAKSGGAARSVAERRRIREECGYPDGGRHELLSVRLAERAAAMLAGRNRDLVLHLIASHHGACRPFAPVVLDPLEDLPSGDVNRVARVELDSDALEADVVTGLERFDSGVATRFWTLNRRYGWWGLAFLEAILRVADWCRSEEEQDLDERADGEEAA